MKIGFFVKLRTFSATVRVRRGGGETWRNCGSGSPDAPEAAQIPSPGSGPASRYHRRRVFRPRRTVGYNSSAAVGRVKCRSSRRRAFAASANWRIPAGLGRRRPGQPSGIARPRRRWRKVDRLFSTITPSHPDFAGRDRGLGARAIRHIVAPHRPPKRRRRAGRDDRLRRRGGGASPSRVRGGRLHDGPAEDRRGVLEARGQAGRVALDRAAG